MSSPQKKRTKTAFSVADKTRIINIYKACAQEAQGKSKVENVAFTAKAAGITERSVYGILKEYATSHEFQPPKKYKRKRAILDKINEETKCVIRRKVHEFFLTDESPTVEKVMVAINRDGNLPNLKITTLRTLLKELNFTFNRKATKIERPQHASQEEAMLVDSSWSESPRKDVAVQLNGHPLTELITSLLNSDKKLSAMTGVKTSRLLQEIVNTVAKIDHPQTLKVFSVRERVILTLIKLKCNMLFTDLAAIFRTSPETCKTVFAETVALLASVMSTLITFPPKKEITRNLPQLFKGLENVRVIVDCTEIPIKFQKCRHLCSVKCTSHYKKEQTVKFMTGVSPGGLITYMSKAYGGGESDRAIFEKSQIIKLLLPGVDAVMVDKGFEIDKIATENWIQVIRPPYILTNLAARAHIERVNQRLKSFAILNGPIGSSLLPCVEQMFVTICGLVNLSPPVVDENKFL